MDGVGDSDGVGQALAALLSPRPGDGVTVADGDRIRATYVLQGVPSLAAAADAVAVEASTGSTTAAPDVVAAVGGRVVAVEAVGWFAPLLPSAPLRRDGVGSAELGRVTVDWPVTNAASLAGLLNVVLGETNETGAFGACRLVGLALPAGWIGDGDGGADGMAPPAAATARFGPRFGVDGVRAASGVRDRPLVGAIVKPSTGLDAEAFAAAAHLLALGGCDFVKDDELLGDPVGCRFADRVRATRGMLAHVEASQGRRVLYAPNVTGPLDGLSDRIALAREAGCGMVMVNAFVMGLEVLRHVARHAGVPVLAHRVGAGPLMRSTVVGASPAIVAGLTRLAGGDVILAGGVQGKLYEEDAEVLAAADACLRPLGDAKPSMPMNGGGHSAETVGPSLAAFGHVDFVHLLGARATEHPDGPEVGVRLAREAVLAASTETDGVS